MPALLGGIFLAVVIIAAGTGALYAGGWMRNEDGPNPLGLVLGGWVIAAGWGLAGWIVLRKHGWDRRRLRLRPRDFRRRRGMALRYELAVLPVLLAYAAAVQALGFEPERDEVGIMFSAGGPTTALAVLLIVAAAPLAEELFFRGLLQGVLTRWIGSRGGIVVSAVLFGLLHGLWSFAPVFLLGLVLAYGRNRGRSLAMPVMMHALNNTLVLLFYFADPSAGA